MAFKTFNQYMELVEIKPNYFDKIADELGVNPDDLNKFPQWVANSSVGKITTNGMTYEVKILRDSSGNISGGVLKPLDVLRGYFKDDKNRLIRNPSKFDDSVKVISKDELVKMLTQDLDSLNQQMQGGPDLSMGGPPMGGP